MCHVFSIFALPVALFNRNEQLSICSGRCHPPIDGNLCVAPVARRVLLLLLSAPCGLVVDRLATGRPVRRHGSRGRGTTACALLTVHGGLLLLLVVVRIRGGHHGIAATVSHGVSTTRRLGRHCSRQATILWMIRKDRDRAREWVNNNVATKW